MSNRIMMTVAVIAVVLLTVGAGCAGVNPGGETTQSPTETTTVTTADTTTTAATTDEQTTTTKMTTEVNSDSESNFTIRERTDTYIGISVERDDFSPEYVSVYNGNSTSTATIDSTFESGDMLYLTYQNGAVVVGPEPFEEGSVSSVDGRLVLTFTDGNSTIIAQPSFTLE